MMLLGAMKKRIFLIIFQKHAQSNGWFGTSVMVNCHPYWEWTLQCTLKLGCNSSMLWNKDLSLVLKETLSR